MCLLDTTDGALMLALYVQPAANFLPPEKSDTNEIEDVEREAEQKNHRDPIAFLYYSIVLTCLTVMAAIVIGVIQVLSLVLNVANPTGKFWDGVQTAGDYYDAIGGGIAGCFVVVGVLSVFAYKPWRGWIARRHGKGFVSETHRDGTTIISLPEQPLKEPRQEAEETGASAPTGPKTSDYTSDAVLAKTA